jgi:hypothetical protein
MSEQPANRAGSDFAALLFIGFAVSTVLGMFHPAVSTVFMILVFGVLIVGGIVQKLRKNRTVDMPPAQSDGPNERTSGKT